MTNVPSFEGWRIHWFWSSSNKGDFHHWSVFVSEEMYDYCGRFSTHFDEPDVSEEEWSKSEELTEVDISKPLSPVRIRSVNPLRASLSGEKVPEDRWREVAVPEELLVASSVDELFVAAVSSSSRTTSKNKHNNREDQIRQSNQNLSNQPVNAEYSGPLFGYAIDERSREEEGSTLLERRAPINTAWDTGLGTSAVRVSTVMEQNGWNGRYNISPEKRYVIIRTGAGFKLRNLDDDAGKAAGMPMKQWHCRLYNIPDSMDENHDVAGQAHKDPQDHNKIGKYLGSGSWHFRESRKKVGSDWSSWNYSKVSSYIGNGNGFSSSRGEMDTISK